MSRIDDDEIARRLRADVDRMVGDAGRSAPPPAPPIRRDHRAGPRWIPIGVAAATVAVLVGGLIVIANRDTDDRAPAVTSPATTAPTADTVPTSPSSVPPSTVSGEDPLLEAIASVIDEGDGPLLCFSVLDSLPPQCGSGLTLAAWSWDVIDVEIVQGGTTWVDQIYVLGTYSAGDQKFTVTEVRLPTDEDRQRVLLSGSPPDFSVPCPEPEGGWPARDQGWPAEIAQLAGYAGAWLDESQQVMTVKFTGDLAAAEAAVREYYADALCVVAATHTEAELQAIQGQLMQMSSVQFLSTGISVDATGERVEAQTAAPEPELQAAFDAEFGPGVVRLSSLLRPVGGGGEAPTPVTRTPTAPSTSTVQLVEAVATVLESDVHGPQLCVEGILDSGPPQCAGGPFLDGWAWDAIADEESFGGTTWGVAYVMGEYDSATNVLTVQEQRPPDDADAARFAAAFPQPDHSTPCPEPADGWPATDQEWPAQQVAALDGFAGAWAEAGGPMTVKFTGDPAAAEAAVARLYSGPFCVVAATRTLAELDAIRTELEATGELFPVSVVVDVTGEWVDAVSPAPRPELQADLDARFGAGVVRLRSLMLPVT